MIKHTLAIISVFILLAAQVAPVNFLELFSPVSAAPAINLAACSVTTQPVFGQKPELERQAKIAASLATVHQQLLQSQVAAMRNRREAVEKPALSKLAKQRAALLLEAIQRDPQSTLASILSVNERQVLNSVAEGCVEQESEVEGVVAVMHADYFTDKTAQVEYQLQLADGQIIYMYPTGTDASLSSGVRVKVKGYRLNNRMLLDSTRPDWIQPLAASPKGGTSSFSIVPEVQAAGAETVGIQQTLVLMVRFNDTITPNVSPSQMEQVVFTQLRQYYEQASYGKMSLAGNAIGWLTINQAKTCNYELMKQQAVALSDSQVG